MHGRDIGMCFPSEKYEQVPAHVFADSLAYEVIHNFAKDYSSAIAKAVSPLMKSPVRIAPRCLILTVHFVPDICATLM